MAKVLNKADKIIICVIAVLVAVAVLAGVIVYSVQIRDNTTVATVNGLNISAGELQNQMLRDRADIIKYYKDKYDFSVDNGFWSTSLEGTTPMNKLRETALENVKAFKLEQQLGIKYNIIDDASNKAFMKAFNSENAARADKLAKGEVIYGPKEYTVDSYYDYYRSNMEIKLKEEMSKQGGALYATEEQLKAFYEEQKAVYYSNADTAKFKCFTLAFKGGEDVSKYTKEQATEIITKVMQLIKTDKDYVNKIAKLYPDVKKIELSLNKDNASQASKTNPILYGVAKDLKTGTVSDVFEDKYLMRVVICNSRVSGGYISFDECRDTVQSQYNTAKFDEYIQSLCDTYELKTNGKYNKVKIK